SGLTEFYFIPSSALLAPQQTQTVALRFCPDHPSLNYSALVDIAGHRLTLTARCHSRQLFVMLDDSLKLPALTLAANASLAAGVQELTSKAAPREKLPASYLPHAAASAVATTGNVAVPI